MKRIIRYLWDDFKTAYPLSLCVQVSTCFFFALFILDYFDVMSSLIIRISNYSPVLVIISSACFAAVFLAWCFRSLHFFSLIKFRIVNWLDFALVITFSGFLLYCTIRELLWGLGNYETVFTSILTSVLFLMLIRIVVLLWAKTRADKCGANLVDLRDLYYNQYPTVWDGPIQIAENDVDYDLIGREITIDQLFQAIICCQSNRSYVISLEGEWGSGKTTILNNVVSQLKEEAIFDAKVVVINDFDPWLYGSQKAMLNAMYNRLIASTGIKCNPHNSEDFLRDILSACVSQAAEECHVGSLADKFFSSKAPMPDSIKKIKKRISSFLRASGKRFVFIIDNLDRANDDNIVFLFKLISIVFDFPGVIYVLSFDRERIDKILEKTNDFNHRFLEKIIQQEIYVPKSSGEDFESVCFGCMYNLMTAYHVPQSQQDHLKSVLTYIVSKTDNLRTFKRMLNTVFPIVFLRDHDLFTKDLLSIEVIRFFEPELYRTIWQNRKFFISIGGNWKYSVLDASKEKFNTTGDAFFQQLSASYPKELDLLEEMFPYVQQYNNGKPLIMELTSQEEEKQALKNQRIFHVFYFDLYFTAGTNGHTYVNKSVKETIESINQGSQNKQVWYQIKNSIQNLNSERQKEWVIQFQMYLPDIREEYRYQSAVILTQALDIFSTELYFGELSVDDRLAYIISDLLTHASEVNVQEYIGHLRTQYGKLKLVQRIQNSLGSPQFDEQTEERIPGQFKELYSSMCENILNDRIDIYQAPYYRPNNSSALIIYCQENNKKEKLKDYFTSVLSGETVYRILWDLSGFSISTCYNYYIYEKKLIEYFGDIERIRQCLGEKQSLSEDEQFVRDIFNKSLSGKVDYDGEPIGVVSSVKRNPVL